MVREPRTGLTSLWRGRSKSATNRRVRSPPDCRNAICPRTVAGVAELALNSPVIIDCEVEISPTNTKT